MKSISIVFMAILVCSGIAVAEEKKARWLTTRTVSEEWKEGSSIRIMDKRTVAELQAALKESRDVWDREKTARGNSYAYSRAFGSWTGFGHRTVVKVRNGVVVARRFEAFDRDKNITSAFTEGPAEINTHDGGAVAKTMDALYDECAATCLTQNPETHSLSLEFTETGILNSCTYTPYGCADDCSRGLNRVTVSWEVE